MKWNEVKTCGIFLLLLGLLTSGRLAAQDEGNEVDEDASFEEALGRFYEAQDRRRVKTPYEKVHRNTLSEFEPAVRDARASTVKVIQGDYVKALGTVVAREGLVITKASEIEGDGGVELEFVGGKKLTAEVVEVNEATDLALLWVHDFDLTPVNWASGREAPVGSLVATPGSMKLPIAVGCISLPVRNLSESNKGFLGVRMQAAETGEGLTVVEVVANSGAERAGIEPGDLIQAIDGQPMRTEYDLQNTISEGEPGDVVAVQLVRGEEAMIVEVTLGDRESGFGYYMPRHEMLDNTARMGGRVSRKRSGYLAAIQHDMLLKPNQCGGPLVDLDGRVIGVNIARASRVKSYAIPSESVEEWLGDPATLAARVLQRRLESAEEARREAEEALAEAQAREADVKAVIEELEQERATQEGPASESAVESKAGGASAAEEVNDLPEAEGEPIPAEAEESPVP